MRREGRAAGAARAGARAARRTVALGALCVAAAGASLLVPAAPSYDQWAWLQWGRELGRLELSTAEGPAFKPLPVAVAALLAPAGSAAPLLWLVVARAGALAALVAAFAVARRLAGGGRAGAAAGAAAAAGVALTGGFARAAAVGDSEPLFVALALGAFAAALAERHGRALGLAGAAALIRVEAWPFLAAYATWRAARDPALRPAVALLALAVPAAWLLPEWLGSGDVLRSGARALVPNAGAPALADRPALAALATGAAVAFAPLAIAAPAARARAARILAAGGAAWLVLVALMAEAGFSGEPRYALPGAAAIAVGGGAGLARLARLAGSVRARAAAAALVALAVLPFAAGRVEEAAGLLPRLRHEAGLVAALPDAIARAGGRERLLACGRPAVGRLRGTLLAYHLEVEKRHVRADGRPAAVTFRSRLGPTEPLEPPGRARRRAVVAGPWRVETACATGARLAGPLY